MSKFKKLDRKVRKMDLHDIQLTKLTTLAFVLFLLAVWPALHDLLMKVHWGWYLAVGLIAMWRPMKKFWGR